MKNVQFGSAVIENGDNKGKARKLEYATAIKAENNTTGLPVNSKGVVSIIVSPASISVPQFETFEEVSSRPSFQTEVVELYNGRLKAKVAQSIVQWAKKQTLAPSEVNAAVAAESMTLTAAGLLAESQRGKGLVKSSLNAKLADLVEQAKTRALTSDELLAAMQAMIAKKA